MSTYFLLDPFEFPYYFYRILGELIYVLSIIVCIKPNNGILASLDVENLFTNVPVNETIDVIINNIYFH